jgi:hypothetical protein
VKTKYWLVLILLIASFLRLWQLSYVPVSLFGDEMDVGYHAYSIAKTGKDYSGNFMPLHFESLAEWRTPLYLYSAVPTVGVFGITPLGVRLPAALFGILSILGMYLLVREILNMRWKEKRQILGQAGDDVYATSVALTASFILAINPWHIQYSRAGFEVTMLLAFLLFGLYFFFRALRTNGEWLWLSGTLLVLTPFIYSTAKLFTPFLMLFLLIVWWRQIISLPKKPLVLCSLFIVLLGLPIAYSTLLGGGTQRIGYISVFTDPTIEPEVGTGRLSDAVIRGDAVTGYHPTVIDRFYHNKIVFWTERITSNYLQSYSTDFLFNNGDPNLRHSIKGVGQFFKIEFFALLLGLILFFTGKGERRTKCFFIFWLLAGVIPASITRDGGNHATRLILILPPLVFLMAYGLVGTYRVLPKLYSKLLLVTYALLLFVSFLFYQHTFWVHNPWDSERWWHYGWSDAMQTIKTVDSNYDRVIISMSGEPAWIFFASGYQYDPIKWHQGYPMAKATLNGYGEISYIDKFYFGSFHPESGGIYDLPKYIDNKTLYLANAKEIGANLIQEPERVPNGLLLVRAIAYPSGEPAFYLFTHN